MSGTALSGYDNNVLCGGADGGVGIQNFVHNGTTMIPGDICRLDTAYPDVSEAKGHATILASVETALGVVLNEPSLGIDTAFADNLSVRVALLKSGLTVWMAFKASVGAILTGDDIYLSVDDGHAQVHMTYTTPTTPDAAENELANEENAIAQATYLGKAAIDSADVAAVRWCKVRLC